jgi:hypothetical protein
MTSEMGLRKEKPKRKMSSCYFDPWKQSLDVIGQLLKKEKIHLFRTASNGSNIQVGCSDTLAGLMK